MSTYSIWEGNIEEVRNRAAKIIAKCEKYNCSFCFEEVGETFEVREGEVYRYITVEIEGFAVCGDWEVIASIDHLKEGNFVLSFNGGNVPSKYLTAKANCDHCNTNRYRKVTFIVKNIQDGSYRQVGSACLTDYTGISLEGAVNIKNFFNDIVKDEFEKDFSGYTGRYFNTLETLAFAVKTVQENGYVKKADETYRNPSTANRVKDAQKVIRQGFNVSPYIEEAKAMLAWAQQMNPNGDQYLNNVQVISKMAYVETRHIGFLVSLIPTYQRAMREAEEAKNSTSVWLGEVGKKLSVQIVKASLLTSWETMYGLTNLYQFNDNEGNIIIWKTSKELELDSIKSLTGSVKSHNTYKGIQQTELTRCFVTQK